MRILQFNLTTRLDLTMQVRFELPVCALLLHLDTLPVKTLRFGDAVVTSVGVPSQDIP